MGNKEDFGNEGEKIEAMRIKLLTYIMETFHDKDPHDLIVALASALGSVGVACNKERVATIAVSMYAMLASMDPELPKVRAWLVANHPALFVGGKNAPMA